MKAEDLDEYIRTDFDSTLLLAKEIGRIVSEQRMERLMREVAAELQDAGVDFSKADINKI